MPGADGVEETSTKVLGIDPESGLEVTLRSGRFGPYVQLGEAVNGEKPKRAGVPRGTDPGAVDLDMAIKLLSLPREVGRHPEDGEPIMAGIGRFGAYVQHGKTYANVESGDDVLHIGLNRAVTLIAEKISPMAAAAGRPHAVRRRNLPSKRRRGTSPRRKKRQSRWRLIPPRRSPPSQALGNPQRPSSRQPSRQDRRPRSQRNNPPRNRRPPRLRQSAPRAANEATGKSVAARLSKGS